jgi:flagellar motor switch protein FliG
MRDLNEVLTQILSGTEQFKKSAGGGIEAAAEILNHVDATLEASISSHIRAVDPGLAQKIRDKMFVFENLMNLDDRGIQLLLRQVQPDTLVVALQGTTDALRDPVVKSMSERAAQILREDLEAKGPVRLAQVEAEQREILRIVRRLAEEGQIEMDANSEARVVE